ncbi:recombinase family protein [Luteibacter pinisoli]|nr:recombinase family protein [Luteibacter pinisoli]
MQQYSIANQAMTIGAYADAHAMDVVRTYRDDGRSGLTIEHRPALQALIRDVTGGHPGYAIILVLDVSRWGRFQRVDEAAFYEFLCWRAGVKVIYVAEAFANDDSPFAMIVKSIKRMMSAEYSRELSGKTVIGHRRLAGYGFHQGGKPGYGLARVVVDSDGKRRMGLKPGQWKGTATDRVLLVPGALHERRLVRWMFEQTAGGASFKAIARDLNARGEKTAQGNPWNCRTVAAIINSEKYIGNLVYGRHQKRLGARMTGSHEDDWVRCDGAIRPIIPRALFDAAHEAHKGRQTRMDDEAILRRARLLLEREGRLSTPLIDAEPGMPASQVCGRRFGGLTNMYRNLGYVQQRNAGCADARRAISTWRRSVTAFLADWLDENGSAVEQDGWHLRIDRAWTLSVTVLNASGKGKDIWFNHRPVEPTDVVVYARIRLGEAAPLDYIVLPGASGPVLPHRFYQHNGPLVDSCTYPSLAIIGDLARLSRLESQRCG